MANDTRNPADVLRDKVAQGIQVTAPKSALNDGGSAGQGGAGTFSLTFRDAGGNAKKWFKWSRHHFDDPNAMFY